MTKAQRFPEQCTNCGKTIHTSHDEWGDPTEPICWDCYRMMETVGALEPEVANVKTCPFCGKMSLYHKIDAGYPGLYHCIECRTWIDKTAGEWWRYARTGGKVKNSDE